MLNRFLRNLSRWLIHSTPHTSALLPLYLFIKHTASLCLPCSVLIMLISLTSVITITSILMGCLLIHHAAHKTWPQAKNNQSITDLCPRPHRKPTRTDSWNQLESITTCNCLFSSWGSRGLYVAFWILANFQDVTWRKTAFSQTPQQHRWSKKFLDSDFYFPLFT